jgi:hypothetical protein
MFAAWLMVTDLYFVISSSVTQKKSFPHDTNSKGSYRYSNGYSPAVPLVVLEPTLHKLYGREVCGGHFLGRTVTDVESVPTSLTLFILL